MNFGDWPSGLLALAFLAGAVAVWLAGARLARLADAIAVKTGLGRAFLGMVLLGGATALPELAVSVTATVRGNPILAVNNVLGSAAVNMVILAVADAFIGRKALTSKVPSSAVLLQGVLSIMLMAMVIGAVIAGGPDLLGMGLWSWAILLVYVLGVALLSQARSAQHWTPHPAAAEPKPGTSREGSWNLHRLSASTALAAIVIVIGGFTLAESGGALAERTGLGASFFGAIFLGAATSLPEVSTIVGAMRIRQYELAISDAIGAAMFNVVALVVIDALHTGGPVLVEAGRFAAFAALLALVLAAVLLLGMLERRDRTVLRMGYDSAAILVIYAIGVAVLYGLR